mmetsp:Transcript_34290/g.118160  ORF Transcript_34290/g.118160 Transcript_34290/m.118160 type:complete len:245 (+) Transcript_34290:113-847(+)
MTPAWRTTMMSESRTVEMRCAMTTMVAALKPSASRSVRWMASSEARSTDAVASSTQTTRRRSSSARAVQSSCRSPSERLLPSSSTWRSSVPSLPSKAWSAASVVRMCGSACSPKGSRLKRSVPLNKCGACGMTATAFRSCARGTVRVSRPSKMMAPPEIKLRRENAETSDDLPEPLRPTMPTFAPDGMESEMPWRTSGRPSAYLTRRSRSSSAPDRGQPSSALEPAFVESLTLDVKSSAGSCVP